MAANITNDNNNIRDINLCTKITRDNSHGNCGNTRGNNGNTRDMPCQLKLNDMN